jgi:hypothetical protein
MWAAGIGSFGGEEGGRGGWGGFPPDVVALCRALGGAWMLVGLATEGTHIILPLIIPRMEVVPVWVILVAVEVTAFVGLQR